MKCDGTRLIRCTSEFNRWRMAALYRQFLQDLHRQNVMKTIGKAGKDDVGEERYIHPEFNSQETFATIII